MVQSDTLSRWPDLVPDEDHDNEDIVLLPDKLFINLINLDLQRRIAHAKDFDFDANEVIQNLLENGPINLRHDLQD